MKTLENAKVAQAAENEVLIWIYAGSNSRGGILFFPFTTA